MADIGLSQGVIEALKQHYGAGAINLMVEESDRYAAELRRLAQERRLIPVGDADTTSATPGASGLTGGVIEALKDFYGAGQINMMASNPDRHGAALRQLAQERGLIPTGSAGAASSAAPSAPKAPASTPGGAAPQPGQYADPNRPFLFGQHVSHLNDLIKEDPSFGLLLNRLVGGYEDRAGGKFSEPLRSTFQRKGRNLAGLFDLENAADPTFIDYGTATGDYLGSQLYEGGNVYDNPSRPGQHSGASLITRALDAARANTAAGRTGTGLFAPDPSGRGNVRQLQRRALEAAMGLDLAPTFGSTIDNTLDDLESRFRALAPQDAGSISDTGSFLEYARKLGVI